MKTGNQLIQKTFHSILIVNAVSMVSAILCTLIDSIVTGQFLGTEAITAAGLITPVVLMTNLLGALLGPGVTVVCSRLIGMAQPKRSNQAFSLVVITDILALGTVSVLLYAASPVIARLLGSATGSAQIVQMITDYLRGFSFGLLPMCLTMGLTGLMLLDNDRKCGLLTMFVTLGADVTFDLANALFFHRGMMGMAIATSLSYVLGLCVLLTHFTKKDRILHFTLQGLRPGDLKDVVLCGIPSVITMGSQVLRGLIFNVLLLSVAWSSAVASLAVANAAFSVINVLGISMFNSTTTLCSMLYGEEDRTGLLTAQAVAMRTVTACFAVIAALVLLLARPIAGLFLNASAVEELTQAARLIRLLAVQNGLYSLSYSLCGGYQGTHKLKMNYSLAFLREGVLPLLCIAGLGLLLGLRGFEMGYVAVGSLTLLLCFLIPAVKNGKLSAAPEDLLMLSPAFAPPVSSSGQKS
jgi:Na+-driven multidrug efflux pump